MSDCNAYKTFTIAGNPEFQFSAALSSGCNTWTLEHACNQLGVSILSRPLERLQRAPNVQFSPSFSEFQFSAALSSGCNCRQTPRAIRPTYRFNSQPPSRAAATAFQNIAYFTLSKSLFARTSSRGGSIHESIAMLIFKERFVERLDSVYANLSRFRLALQVRAVRDCKS